MYDNLIELERTNWWYAGRRGIVEQFLNYYADTKQSLEILDVGCGMGGNLVWLNKYGAVWGIDPDPSAVAYTQTRVSHPERISVGSLPDNASLDRQFDCVIAADVLEHIVDDQGALQFIFSSCLKPGGKLFMAVPAFQWLWSSHDELNMHQRRYHRRELEEKLTAAGFKILKLSYYNAILFPVIAAAKVFYKLFFRHSTKVHFDKSLPRPLNAFLAGILRFEKKILQYVDLPFGVSLVAVAMKPETTRIDNK